MHPSITEKLYCFVSVLSCFFLSLLYVGSLYVWNWNMNRPRHDPGTIKRRFISVFCMMIISPFYVMAVTRQGTLLDKDHLMEMFGFKWEGALTATVLPLILTMILFTGPLAMQYYNGQMKVYRESRVWASCFQNIFWLRNHVVAPMSEEFIFRACMMTILRQDFYPLSIVLGCPLFFGVAHFHHLLEQLRLDREKFRALCFVVGFQFMYTTIFGIYSAFLFYRTGHFIAPFIVHSFCNHMGFPNFNDIQLFDEPKRAIVVSSFLVGLVLWALVLFPFTEPTLYGNTLVWHSDTIV